MSLLLNVPFSEKDQAKSLGAKWNPEIKRWYASDRTKYKQFLRWIDGSEIVCNHIYLVEGLHTCFRCQQPTHVIGFGFETYFEIDDEQIEYLNHEIHIGSIKTELPMKLAEELRKRYNFYWGYSKTTQSNDYGNHCQHCNVLQGNFFIFDEVDSPFFVDSKQTAEKLILYKIKLSNDISLIAEIGYGSEDHHIKQNAEFIDSDLQWT